MSRPFAIEVGLVIQVAVHWWRLATEPSGMGRLMALQPRRWFVRYRDGFDSCPMAYDTACEYVRMFGGQVKRYRGKDAT